MCLLVKMLGQKGGVRIYDFCYMRQISFYRIRVILINSVNCA